MSFICNKTDKCELPFLYGLHNFLAANMLIPIPTRTRLHNICKECKTRSKSMAEQIYTPLASLKKRLVYKYVIMSMLKE